MDRSEYLKHAHAMQSGVAMDMNINPKPTEPKHLRVGINSTMADHAGLVGLLISKGVFTEKEYLAAITQSMKEEKERYEAYLSEKLKSKITLV